MNITRGKITGTAKKVLLYGPEGIGKSTFASRFPDPVFIDTEGSTKELDIARFDAPTSWTMLKSQVQYVADHPEVCRTLVIDTADWAERMCIDSICKQRKLDSIESAGYGKGYVYVKEEFGELLNLLSDVVEKGVNVVLTAHAQMRKFEQPDEAGAFDRWELKLEKKTAPMVKEWADMVLFANYKTRVVKVDGKNKAQGGARVMYTTHHNCWDAKNRYGLPDELPFDYKEIEKIIESEEKKENNTKEEKKEKETEKTKEAKKTKEETKETEEAREKTKETNEETKEIRTVASLGEAVVTDENLDKRIPKALRDLMIADKVSAWGLQNVVNARQPGVFPYDMDVWDYPQDFIDEWILPNWSRIVKMDKELRENEYIPY